MAIAGLVIMGAAGRMETVHQALAHTSGIVDVRRTDDPTRLAVVLDTPADKVESALTALLQWEGVLTADLAYVNYEDDLAAGGHIPCPPHTPKKKRKDVA